MTNGQEFFSFVGPLERQFRIYHEKNPEVYLEILDTTRTLKRAGHNFYGMKSIIEVVRWHRNIKTRGGEEFKINNNYAPFYARMIMAREPELSDFFNIRSQKHPCTF
jgi:hypothetical protein